MIYVLLGGIAVLVLAWNIYPPLRRRMRGLSTIIEGAIGLVLTYFGVFADAIQEAQLGGFLPENIETIAPAVIFCWIVLKRVQTKTPVGKGDALVVDLDDPENWSDPEMRRALRDQRGR